MRHSSASTPILPTVRVKARSHLPRAESSLTGSTVLLPLDGSFLLEHPQLAFGFELAASSCARIFVAKPLLLNLVACLRPR